MSIESQVSDVHCERRTLSEENRAYPFRVDCEREPSRLRSGHDTERHTRKRRAVPPDASLATVASLLFLYHREGEDSTKLALAACIDHSL